MYVSIDRRLLLFMEAWQKVSRGGGRKILIIDNKKKLSNGDFKKITIHIVAHIVPLPTI